MVHRVLSLLKGDMLFIIGQWKMLHVLLTFWGSGMGHFPEDSLICVIYDAAAKGPLVV